MSDYQILANTPCQRVSDDVCCSIVENLPISSYHRLLVLIWPQLGDFDSLEYAWWLQRESQKLKDKGVIVRAIGIGDRNSGLQFCHYTQFPSTQLWVDPTGTIHQKLKLYQGLTLKYPLLTPSQTAWLNLMLMCAGISSPNTLKEVLRGYTGDKTAPQLIGESEVIEAKPLPPLKGSFFNLVGGSGFQRPFELATLRLRNMTEVLSHWRTYVPNSSYLTQRGGTFLWDETNNLLYKYVDQGILGFAENMSQPLSFLEDYL
ncbi:MAG: peroxiredoxin-like family protein [Microcystaceae cyanobacterium]